MKFPGTKSPSKPAVLWLLLFLAVLGLLPGQVLAQSEDEQLADRLRSRISAGGVLKCTTCKGDIVFQSPALPQFYVRRDFRPAWITEKGPLPEGDALVMILLESGNQGLRPQDYHVDAIRDQVVEINGGLTKGVRPTLERRADFDLLLTEAFFLYGTQMLSGRVDPQKLYTTRIGNPPKIYSSWVAHPRSADLAKILQEALETHQIRRALQQLEPLYPEYDALREALIQYRRIAAQGGWSAIPGGPTLKKGSREKRVGALRTRLAASGDLDPVWANADNRFDDVLAEAVRHFQKRHGLKVDGAVRTETLKALNTPVEQRIRQIELNMEHWRWLPESLGEFYIAVNILNFGLEVFNGDQPVMAMRVITGRRIKTRELDLRTPVFTGKMTHLEINPYWNVPHSIAVKEFLPEIKEDPQFLNRKSMKLFAGRQIIDPETVDWTTVNEKNFRYQIRQDPGDFNALSRIKFLFPNRFDVYLHDTPTRNLFKRSPRDFSHGCIRIEKPIDLAIYLLHDEEKWSRDKIMAAIRKGKNQVVYLPKPITVHILYWTAWVDEEGTLQLRDDIYGYETILDDALYGHQSLWPKTSSTRITP